jgi:hypothetical protein
MKLKLVKASQGLVWVRQGMLACRKQPLGYVGLIGLTGFVNLVLLGLLEPLGDTLVAALMPLIWIGFMLATRRVLINERITPSVMIEALKGPDAPRKPFALLGGVYVLATMAALQLAQWLGPDPDALDRVTESTKDMAELFANPLVREAILWRTGLTLPLPLLIWHAPALVLWGRLPVAKALFFSAVATWRNLGAFAVFALAWGGISLALALTYRALLALIGEPAVVNVLALAGGMWLAAAFYASLYFTVVDSFEAQGQDEAPAAP